MDSQEQYEALLARWGFEDRSVERRIRREKLVRQAKKIASAIKAAYMNVTVSTFLKAQH